MRGKITFQHHSSLSIWYLANCRHALMIVLETVAFFLHYCPTISVHLVVDLWSLLLTNVREAYGCSEVTVGSFVTYQTITHFALRVNSIGWPQTTGNSCLECPPFIYRLKTLEIIEIPFPPWWSWVLGLFMTQLIYTNTLWNSAFDGSLSLK